MKLSYRERIILIVAIILVILGIGIFVFIKPKYEKMTKNKEKYEKIKQEWDTQLAKFDDIPVRQKLVRDGYQKGLDISKHFTDEMTSVEMDELLQSYMNTEEFIKNEASAKSSMSVTDEKANSISYFFYTPNVVTYPLYEAADLDGSLAKEASEKLFEANTLKARRSQTISGGEESFTVRIKYDDLMTFLDKIVSEAGSRDDAMLITSVKLKDAAFNDGTPGKDEEVTENAETDDEGNPIQQQNNDDDEKKKDTIKRGYTDVTVTYKALYIQEPREPEVGPEYDASIWKGNEWRTKSAKK